MKYSIKKLMAVFLSTILLLGVMPTFKLFGNKKAFLTVAAYNQLNSGYCGSDSNEQNLQWIIEDGILTISGTGGMKNNAFQYWLKSI